MKRPRFKDLRQGVTVYTVMGFDPLCCDVTGKVWNAWIEKHFVTGKPYMHTDIGWRVPTTRTLRLGGTQNEGFFLGTYNVPDTPEPQGSRTAHLCFWTRKAAQRYSDRMRSGCLTKREQEHAKSWADFRDALDSMSSHYSSFHDDYSDRVDLEGEEEPENDEFIRI